MDECTVAAVATSPVIFVGDVAFDMLGYCSRPTLLGPPPKA